MGKRHTRGGAKRKETRGGKAELLWPSAIGAALAAAAYYVYASGVPRELPLAGAEGAASQATGARSVSPPRVPVFPPLLWADTPAARGLGARVETISLRHRVFFVHGLLSTEEVAQVARAGGELLNMNRTAERNDQRRHYTWLAPEFGCCERASDVQLLSDIEDRVAALTGAPRHEGEPEFMYMEEEPLVTGNSRRARPNLHHDRNAVEERTVTVLIYLSKPQDGGDTLFPTYSADGAESTPLQKDFEATLGGEYAKGRRALMGENAWNSTILDVSASMCNGELSGLRITPEVGGAVIFYSAEMVARGETRYWGRVLPDAWHGGCPVHSGVKRTMQKFVSIARARTTPHRQSLKMHPCPSPPTCPSPLMPFLTHAHHASAHLCQSHLDPPPSTDCTQKQTPSQS